MANVLKRFGERVHHYRKLKNLSQERLAELANLHRTYIAQIEAGKRNVALNNIAKIAKALGVAAKDLLP